MQAASLLDGLSFDGFPPFKYGRCSGEVDISRRRSRSFLENLVEAACDRTGTFVSELLSERCKLLENPELLSCVPSTVRQDRTMTSRSKVGEQNRRLLRCSPEPCRSFFDCSLALLYLPKGWTDDPARLKATYVPWHPAGTSNEVSEFLLHRSSWKMARCSASSASLIYLAAFRNNYTVAPGRGGNDGCRVRPCARTRHLRRQPTRGVSPASTVCIHGRSMFCPLRITATRRPCSRSRSLITAASAAAPAPSAQLWVAL